MLPKMYKRKKIYTNEYNVIMYNYLKLHHLPVNFYLNQKCNHSLENPSIATLCFLDLHMIIIHMFFEVIFSS